MKYFVPTVFVVLLSALRQKDGGGDVPTLTAGAKGNATLWGRRSVSIRLLHVLVALFASRTHTHVRPW